MMLRSMTQWRSHCLSRGDANTAIGCLVLWWSEMARYVSVIHKNPSSFARGSRRLPLPPRILICAAFFVPPPSFPSFLFFFPALIALRHVAALLRKNFPEQRQKLCSLACLSLWSWRLEEREDSGGRREDLFTATDSDGDGLRSSYCRIFPRPRRNVT